MLIGKLSFTFAAAACVSAAPVPVSPVTASSPRPAVTPAAPVPEPKQDVNPVRTFEPQFRTGYEPGEATGTPADAIDWLTFDNTSSHADAVPWAMSVYYESPGDVNDRYARIIVDPTDPDNHILHYWLKNAVIDAGYQSHTKGRIQTGFPGHLVDAFEVYASQRIYIHEDFNLMHTYPPDGDPWWLGVIIQELWSGAAWEGHPNPSRINISMYSQNGQMHLQMLCKSGIDSRVFWAAYNPQYALPVGEWLKIEIGYRMGNAETGRMVVVITPESTGRREVVFNVTNWTYDPLADEPGGTGPVPLTHWNPQKLYSSDNVIHHIRDAGGTAQVYWDDFAFSGEWPPAFPATIHPPSAPVKQ